jgi:hypothetical protein
MAGQWQIGIVSNEAIARQLTATISNNAIQRMILPQNAVYSIYGIDLVRYR